MPSNNSFKFKGRDGRRAETLKFLAASLRRLTGASIVRDILAGITLATVTIPEQMATARLADFGPQVGLYAFIGASLGFAVFGRNKVLTAGADSTIAPIFAGALAAVAASGIVSHEVSAATLSALVGAILVLSGLLKLGWLANLISTPVITGFLAGIAVHILGSQMPVALGLSVMGDNLPDRLACLFARLAGIEPASAAIGLGVFLSINVAERISARIPGALIGVVAATAAAMALRLEAKGLPVLGVLPPGLPHLALPSFEEVRVLAPLALIVAAIVMMQTAAVTASFSSSDDGASDINRDFLGLGAGNLMSALIGAFPVNASPPRTAVVVEAGGRSQVAPLAAAAIVFGLAIWGRGLLAHVPDAALAGVLLYVAQRIFRFGLMTKIARQSHAEGALVLATAAAIVFFPIQTGVAIGLVLSLLHGIWIATRTVPVELSRLSGTTVWWPLQGANVGEKTDGVIVFAFQAPLLFANADAFRRGTVAKIDALKPHPALVVLEMSGIADVDFTAAQAMLDLIRYCRARKILFAMARLESVRAQVAFERFGIMTELGDDRQFHSVDDAVKALASC